MDLLQPLGAGFAAALSLQNLAYGLAGVLLGTLAVLAVMIRKSKT